MAETTEKTQVDFIIRPIIRRLNIIGFRLENLNIWTKIWWNYAIFANMIWILLICFHLMETTNIEDICDVVLNVSCLSQPITAILIVRLSRNIIIETVDIMQKQFWFHENEFNEKIVTKHKFNYRMLSRICMGYMICSIICVMVWFLEPVINATGSFPMDMSFPYRNFIKESPYYQIIYFNQFVTVSLGAACVVLVDLLYLVSLGFVLLQVDLIKQKLKMLISGNDDEKDICEKLKECIIHHNIVLNALKNIEEANKFLILDKLLSDMLCLCVTTYLFTQQQNLNFKFMLILAVSGGQPLLCCFFGDFVTSECATIGEEAYEVNWQNNGYKSVTSALSMMILRSQKPMYMTAGGMIILSLPNYVAFMKMMFSFYLVLKRDETV